MRGLRAQAYIYLGEVYSTLATSRKTAPGEGREHWRDARSMYQHSLDIWQGLQKRGILSVPDAGEPEEIARDIAKCDAGLGK